MNPLDYLFYFTEILAAICGLVYLKYRDSKPSRYFVFLLCLTVLVETYGLISMFVDEIKWLEPYSDYKYIHNSYWIYNFYYVFSYSVYGLLFYFNIENINIKNKLKVVLIVFVISSILNLIFSNILFTGFSVFTNVFGSLIILYSVLYYFYELLSTDRILNFYHNINFYIGIGAVLFHISITPLWIFSTYFNKENSDFVSIYYIILPLAIIFMYTCYSVGFIVCLSKKNSYQKNK